MQKYFVVGFAKKYLAINSTSAELEGLSDHTPQVPVGFHSEIYYLMLIQFFKSLTLEFYVIHT